MKKILLPTLLAAATLFSGCYHVTMTSSAASEPIPSYDRGFKSFWLWGLVDGAGTIDAGQICANGIARYEEQQTIGNGIVTMLTFGIYAPMKVQLWCAANGAASVELLPNDEVVAE